MKKIILLLSILFISFLWINTTFAAWLIEVKVSIDLSSLIPWDILHIWWWCYWKNADWDFICEVPKWVGWFEFIMAHLIKYITFIVSLAWVLFIVVNWILYSMWWADDSLKTESKKRIMKTLTWIIVLLLSWVILKIVAPWVYM